MLNICGSRGTTFIRCHLSIATFLGICDVILCMVRVAVPRYPITGITDKVYSRTDIEVCHVISSCSIGVFFAGCYAMGFPPMAHSLDATEPVTRPFNAFVLFGCFSFCVKNTM